MGKNAQLFLDLFFSQVDLFLIKEYDLYNNSLKERLAYYELRR